MHCSGLDVYCELNYNLMIQYMVLTESLHQYDVFLISGFVEYIHEKGESGGSFSFKFNLEDPEGNKVIDESFFITVLGR